MIHYKQDITTQLINILSKEISSRKKKMINAHRVIVPDWISANFITSGVNCYSSAGKTDHFRIKIQSDLDELYLLRLTSG